MKTKMFALGILILLALSNIVIIGTSAEENQPVWPASWIQADTDPNEAGSTKDYRDVHLVSYSYDDTYLYFRLECFDTPNFTVDHESRYKLFIDTDDPHNMAWQGGNVYDAEFLLFVESSPKRSADGSGDVYLLPDVDGDGFIGDDWPNYLSNPGSILDNSVAGYQIIENCIEVYISQIRIGNPISSYFTWSTDQQDPNLDSTATGDRSDSYWNTVLSKADLGMTISASIDIVYPRDLLTYTLSVTNHGPNDAVNVCITDILPDGITFINAVPWQDGITGLTVWWNLTLLAVGDSDQITINVVINNDTDSGILTNFAVVSSGTHDPMPGNNEAWEETTVGLDTDGDGIPDSDDPDDDNDDWSDVDEIVYDTDPLDPNDYPVDTDGDGIPDSVDSDDDNDGWSDVDEIAHGTDPLDSDDYPVSTNDGGTGGNTGSGSNTGSNDNNGGSTSNTTSDGNSATDGNNTPIGNDSTGVPSFLTENDNNNAFNSASLPLLPPIIPDPSAIEVYPPNAPGVYYAEPATVLFVLLALLLLLFLILYYLRRKRKKNEAQEDRN